MQLQIDADPWVEVRVSHVKAEAMLVVTVIVLVYKELWLLLP